MKPIPFLLAALALFWMSVAPVEPIAFFACGVVVMLFAGAMTAALGWLSAGRGSRGYARKEWTLVAVWGLAGISILLTSWPLRLAVALSRPEMEQTITALKDGHHLSFPRRVGYFTVRAAGVENGVACLWTNPNPDARTGFVQRPPSETAGFGLWSLRVLDDRWQLISED